MLNSWMTTLTLKVSRSLRTLALQARRYQHHVPKIKCSFVSVGVISARVREAYLCPPDS